jgi:hypothetical protein
MAMFTVNIQEKRKIVNTAIPVDDDPTTKQYIDVESSVTVIPAE